MAREKASIDDFPILYLKIKYLLKAPLAATAPSEDLARPKEPFVRLEILYSHAFPYLGMNVCNKHTEIDQGAIQPWGCLERWGKTSQPNLNSNSGQENRVS